MEAKFNIRVSYMKACGARHKAIKEIFDSWEELYLLVKLFMEATSFVKGGMF